MNANSILQTLITKNTKAMISDKNDRLQVTWFIAQRYVAFVNGLTFTELEVSCWVVNRGTSESIFLQAISKHLRTLTGSPEFIYGFDDTNSFCWILPHDDRQLPFHPNKLVPLNFIPALPLFSVSPLGASFH